MAESSEEPGDTLSDAMLLVYLETDKEWGDQLHRSMKFLASKALRHVTTPREALRVLLNNALENRIEFSTELQAVMQAALEARGSFWSMIVEIRDSSSSISGDSVQ